MTFLHLDGPLNTPGGLGKELKGNMQGTNIFDRLKNEYGGEPRNQDKCLKTAGLNQTS